MPRVVKYQFETSKPMPKAPTSGIIRKPISTLTAPRWSERRRRSWFPTFTDEDRIMRISHFTKIEIDIRHCFANIRTKN
jgi:hypothetical protein